MWPGFSFTIGSVTHEPLVADLVDQCDVVFHLAAAVGGWLVMSAPVHTIETNVRGTEIVAAPGHRRNKLVVVASTSEVWQGRGVSVP